MCLINSGDMLDKFWNGASSGCPDGLAPWLRDRGSLTQRIQQRCARFAVRGVRSGLARIALDEAALLGVAPQHLAWSREVFLYADDQPVVFAHSACARQHLRGAWSAVSGLGNKPLGALLFAHPLVERRPLHYKALRSAHPLYQSAAAALTGMAVATPDNETCHARSPLLNPLPQAGEEANDRYASSTLINPPGRLWARRSLFYLHGAPLLVTEVFLPEILRLAQAA